MPVTIGKKYISSGYNGAITAVNGKTGAVALTPSDIGLDNVTNDAQIKRSEMGEANGVALLDINGKLVNTQLPESILGSVNYRGIWDADTNIPIIPTSSINNKGYYYVVSIDGATEIDGINSWSVGDWIISDGSTWSKITTTQTVSSVAGKTGAVILTKTDVGLSNVQNVDQTNADNLSSGTIDIARLPVMGASGINHSSGIVPDTPSVTGATKFLREDGSWSTPAGGIAGTNGQIQFNDSDASGADADLSYDIVNKVLGVKNVNITGNIGINKINPSRKLEVQGMSNYGVVQIIGENNGSNYESAIGFKDTTDADVNSWVIGKNLGNGNTTDRFGVFYNDGEKVVVTTDGKIGAGTAIPVGKLQINRNSLYSDTEYNQHGVIIASGDAFDGNVELYMGADNTNNVGYIQTTGGGSLKPLILQGRGGSIGIGTTDLDGTPSAGVLTVKGTSNDGSTDIIIGRDSDEINVFKVDTDGKITTSTIVPETDSTTAVRITKADKITSVLNMDTTNGRIGINTDTPTNALQIVGGGIRIDPEMKFYLGTHATNHGEMWYEASTNNNLVIRNGTSGGVYLNDPGATSWSASSDERLKDNIVSLDSSVLDKVLNLNPVTYYWKSGDDTTQQVGFIAQEVDALGLDTVVSKPSSDNDFYGLKYEKLIPYLVKAIQEQQKQIDELKLLVNN